MFFWENEFSRLSKFFKIKSPTNIIISALLDVIKLVHLGTEAILRLVPEPLGYLKTSGQYVLTVSDAQIQRPSMQHAAFMSSALKIDLSTLN